MQRNMIPQDIEANTCSPLPLEPTMNPPAAGTCQFHADQAAAIRADHDELIRRDEQIKTIFNSMKDLKIGMKDLGDKLDRSVREISEKVDEIPGKITSAIDGHVKDCVAHKRVMDKISKSDSDGNIDASAFRGQREHADEISQVVDLMAARRDRATNRDQGGVIVPRWVLWIGAGIGAAVAAAMTYLGYSAGTGV